MIENKKGVIPYITKKKFLIGEAYNIFVTDQRLIFSFITKNDKKETERRLNEKVKGKSFKERLQIISTHTYELPERYNELSMDDIVSENIKNFQLTLDQIISIKVKRPKTRDSQNMIKTDYLLLKTTLGKFTITPSSELAIDLLNSVLGDQVKVPKIIL